MLDLVMFIIYLFWNLIMLLSNTSTVCWVRVRDFGILVVEPSARCGGVETRRRGHPAPSAERLWPLAFAGGSNGWRRVGLLNSLSVDRQLAAVRLHAPSCEAWEQRRAEAP